jgi:hypothetical protein
MREGIERVFPRLRGTAYRITSPSTDVYNCIAWAAGAVDAWWWPFGDPDQVYWPEGMERLTTLDAFRQVFAILGYVVCVGEELERGFEKVALFAKAEGIPQHAARQIPNGLWTSKLGRAEDIEHQLHDLEGEVYGTIVLIMKRPLPATEEPSSSANVRS